MKKMPCIVGTAVIARIMAGTMVQAISSLVWPCIWTGSPSPARLRNLMTAYIMAPSTAMNTTAPTQKIKLNTNSWLSATGPRASNVDWK